jgi:mRNA-degrading endonuclease RelE of RelBE toxin-antitoxin system
MSNNVILAKKILKESSKFISSETSDSLNKLIESLEDKNDPDPSEVYLLESIYQYIEKLNLLESHLNKYIQKATASKVKGNKLSSLYENENKFGSSVLFD